MDFLKDFSPMILAKPKSQSLAMGMFDSEVSRTFSGLRSQWTISRLWRYCNAVRIWSGGKEGRRDRGREREGGRKGGREGEREREGGREGGREGRRRVRRGREMITMKGSHFETSACYKLSCVTVTYTDLVDHELGNPLTESAAGTVQDHLEHVSVHLLHHHINLQQNQN